MAQGRLILSQLSLTNFSTPALLFNILYQLQYIFEWWAHTELNRKPLRYERNALTN